MIGSNEMLNALFLAELQALDAFACEREAEGGLNLTTADPDVRRLLEALAFFSARTTVAATQTTAAAVRRIAAGALDELLEPVPAALLVECDGSRLLESVVLPRGTLLRVVDGQRVGLFATLYRSVIRPLEIERIWIDERSGRRVLRVRVRAFVPQSGPMVMPFHVRRLSDYRASLELFDALECHHARAFVEPDPGRGVVNEVPTTTCKVRFGGKLTEAPDDLDDRGPLERLRSLLHFPEQELYVCFHVPALSNPWELIDLGLELGPSFPGDVAVSKDCLRLSVVPAVNAWVDFAEPITCQGLSSVVSLRYPASTLPRVEPTGVRAVYRTGDAGLSPLLPATLAQQRDSYEVEGGGASLRLRIADAFEKPCQIMPEVRWQQPHLWSAEALKPQVAAYARHLPNVAFRPVGAMRAARASVLERDLDRCLDVLAHRMQSRLTRDMLVGMLEILGAADEGPYRGTAALLESLQSAEEPYTQGGTVGIRIAYEIALQERSPEDAALVRRLGKRIDELLNAWTELPVKVCFRRFSTLPKTSSASRRPLGRQP